MTHDFVRDGVGRMALQHRATRAQLPALLDRLPPELIFLGTLRAESTAIGTSGTGSLNGSASRAGSKSSSGLGSRFRHTHDRVGNAVGLLLKAVVWRTDTESRLNNWVRERGRSGRTQWLAKFRDRNRLAPFGSLQRGEAHGERVIESRRASTNRATRSECPQDSISKSSLIILLAGSGVVRNSDSVVFRHPAGTGAEHA